MQVSGEEKAGGRVSMSCFPATFLYNYVPQVCIASWNGEASTGR
jgi:hypothetical protein